MKHSIMSALVKNSVFRAILLHPGDSTIVEQRPFAEVFSLLLLELLRSELRALFLGEGRDEWESLWII